MLISDVCTEFYRRLSQQRLLVLVHCDVDAVCTAAILQELFRGDHVLYTLIPVQGPSELVRVFRENAHLVRLVLLINCGATVDLVTELDPADDVTIYVIDSHRPVDVNNVYSDGQIRIISPVTPEDGVPGFSDLYRDSDSEDSESEPAPRLDAAQLTRRQDRRRWQERRDQLLAEYTQFSYTADCSALLAYSLAVRLSRDTSRLLWCGLVALTWQLLAGQRERQRYILSAAEQQGHVARYNHQADAATTSADCLRLTFEPDLLLSLYRHWSLFDSLRHTPLVACQLKLFTFVGEKRLYELLAELGLPLVQCRQKFASMDMTLRSQVRDLLQQKAEKYQLDGLLYGAFQARSGFGRTLAAADVAHAVAALLEQQTKPAADCWLEAAAALGPRQPPQLAAGLQLAAQLAERAFLTVQSLLHAHLIVSVGAFLYAAVSEGEPHAAAFSRPLAVTQLARFALRAHVAAERSRRSRHLPLVLSVPLPQQPGRCVVVGVPPVTEQQPRNLFGQAFQRAGERIGAELEPLTADGSVLTLSADDRTRFLDALVSLLA